MVSSRQLYGGYLLRISVGQTLLRWFINKLWPSYVLGCLNTGIAVSAPGSTPLLGVVLPWAGFRFWEAYADKRVRNCCRQRWLSRTHFFMVNPLAVCRAVATHILALPWRSGTLAFNLPAWRSALSSGYASVWFYQLGQPLSIVDRREVAVLQLFFDFGFLASLNFPRTRCTSFL